MMGNKSFTELGTGEKTKDKLHKAFRRNTQSNRNI